MSFFLPVLSTFIFLGSTFNLRKYQIPPVEIYPKNMSQYIQVTNISSFVAEYRVIQSPSQYRQYLNIDVATGLKVMVNKFPYRFRSQLLSSLEDQTYDRVVIAVKFSLRTVNESVPYNELKDWKAKAQRLNVTHYVKSIAYGSDMVTHLSIVGRSEQHTNEIRNSVSLHLGDSGVFNSSFKEKFDEILRENEVNFMISSSGTVSFFADNIPPWNVNDLLLVKDNFREIMKTTNDGKGVGVVYEMQSISRVSPEFPLIEINSEILEKLKEIELKYHDLFITEEKYYSWIINLSVELSDENVRKIEQFQNAIDDATNAMVLAISEMDISTMGNINQFDKALDAYGDRNSTDKYKHWLTELKDSIQTTYY